MGGKFAHQYLQQQEELGEQHQQHHKQRGKFLPMLCSSSSTKQVMIKLSRQGQQHPRCSSTSSTTSSSTASDEPSSPRVGCMGQVKRNNKVGGFPISKSFISTFTTTTTTNSSINTSTAKNAKYYKLKRFFSSKSLTASPTTSIATATTTKNGTHNRKVRSGVPCSNKGARSNTVRYDHHHSIRSRPKIDENYTGNITGNNNKDSEGVKGGCLVNLVELDPPLPVVKQQLGESVSLWKRRSGGAQLKSLQVQAVPHTCNQLVQATTV